MELNSVCRVAMFRLSVGAFLVATSLAVTEASLGGPRVCIKDGCLRGTWLRDSVDSIYAGYLGIPFAKPPIGALRFANPQPADPWPGEYNATTSRSPCVQQSGGAVIGREDCLFLNVFSPRRDRYEYNGPLPVFVYIHGGAFMSGSAQLNQLDPARIMATRRVVTVTLQYRLGVLGFLATGDRSAAGNYGMKDQVMALRWVRRNIQAFGGDPSLVTIIGESAGGSSTQFHLLSPLSRGLFHRAVSMSGSALAKWSSAPRDLLSFARAQGRAVGIADANSLSTKDLVDRLRAIDARELVNSANRLKIFDIYPVVLYRPTVEPADEPAPFLAGDPNLLWRTGNYSAVPWLTGTLPTDGSVITVRIYSNSSLVAGLNARIDELLPFFLEAELTQADFADIRQRFLKANPFGPWLTSTNYAEITKMLSESEFIYPMTKSIKLHLQNRRSTPTSVYSFEFRGRYSLSLLYAGTTQSYGLVHADELLYLFRVPVLFPEFPPGSPEAEMSKIWVKYFVDFATKRSAAREGTCSRDACQIETFGNTNNTYFPVRRTLEGRLDEEMYRFWKRILKE